MYAAKRLHYLKMLRQASPPREKFVANLPRRAKVRRQAPLPSEKCAAQVLCQPKLRRQAAPPPKTAPPRLVATRKMRRQALPRPQTPPPSASSKRKVRCQADSRAGGWDRCGGQRAGRRSTVGLSLTPKSSFAGNKCFEISVLKLVF